MTGYCGYPVTVSVGEAFTNMLFKHKSDLIKDFLIKPKIALELWIA